MSTLGKIGRFVFRYKFTLLCSLYFWSIVVMMINHWNAYLGYICFMSIPGVLSIVLVMCILSKTQYALPLTIILSFFIAFDSFFAFIFHNPLYIGAAASIFETNTREVLGTLKLAFLPSTLLWTLSLFLVIMSQRELRKINVSRKRMIISLFFYLCLFLPMSFMITIKAEEGDSSNFDLEPIMTVQKISSMYLPFIYNDFITIAVYKHETFKFKEYGKTQRILPEGIILDSKKETPDKIYLILGESSWRKHYSLYGYPISTTPFLDSLNHTKDVDFKYYNAISSAPITREAIGMALSFSTPFTIDPFFKEKNLIEMANDAGYETVWISNQNKIGLYEGYIGFISSSAKYSCFPNDQNIFRKDFDLIPIMKNKWKPNKKQLFILHTNGEHIPYDMFDEVDELAIQGDRLTQELKYDRSIHYTDRLLRKLYKIADKEQSYLMMYFSDHGEKIGLGHGYMGRGSQQFEIPYITINKSSTPVNDIISQYIDRETALLNSSNTTYIISEILGYSISEKRIEQAVLEGKSIFHMDGKAHFFKDVQKMDK